nr:unnamed protein product [Digitaria exilis]
MWLVKPLPPKPLPTRSSIPPHNLPKNFSAELSQEDERLALVLAAGAPLLPLSAASQGSALPPPAGANPSGTVENETLPPSPTREGSAREVTALALARLSARRRPARRVRRGEDAAARSGKGWYLERPEWSMASARRGIGFWGFGLG